MTKKKEPDLLNPYKYEGDDPDAISDEEQAYNERVAQLWYTPNRYLLTGLRTPQDYQNLAKRVPVGKSFKK